MTELVSALGTTLAVEPGRSVLHLVHGLIADDVYTAGSTYEALGWALFKSRSTGPEHMYIVMPEGAD